MLQILRYVHVEKFDALRKQVKRNSFEIIQGKIMSVPYTYVTIGL
jgi:hypothetical protein